MVNCHSVFLSLHMVRRKYYVSLTLEYVLVVTVITMMIMIIIISTTEIITIVIQRCHNSGTIDAGNSSSYLGQVGVVGCCNGYVHPSVVISHHLLVVIVVVEVVVVVLVTESSIREIKQWNVFEFSSLDLGGVNHCIPHNSFHRAKT